MRATLVGQSGSRKPLLKPRRTTQRTGVIGGRPAPLLPQNWRFTSTSCTFSKTCVFDDFCENSAYFVIRVRPAPSFDQYGLLASTACTFLRRLMLIVFGCFFKNGAPLQREAPFGSPGLSPRGPRPPSGGPAPKGSPKALQGIGLGRLGLSLGSLRAPLWEASGPPKAPQSRSRDGGNMRPVT